MAAGVLEDALQAQLMSYAGISEIESIASSCRSMSMNDRGSDASLHEQHVSESPSMSPTRQPSLGPEGGRTAMQMLPSSEGSFALRHGLSESMAFCEPQSCMLAAVYQSALVCKTCLIKPAQ